MRLVDHTNLGIDTVGHDSVFLLEFHIVGTIELGEPPDRHKVTRSHEQMHLMMIKITM